MEQGLIHEMKGKIWPYDHFESYLYAYDNRYGVIVRRALNLRSDAPMSTEDADKGLYEVAVIGIGLRACDIGAISKANLGELTEELTRDEAAALAKTDLAVRYGRQFSPSRSKFFSVHPDDTAEILDLVRALPERPATHVVRDPIMNRDFPISEAAKLSKSQRLDPDDILK